MNTKRAVEDTRDLERRIEAVVTAFRAETQIDLPTGYLALTAETGDRRDTVDGDFAWWCTRHEAVLAQHGLYTEHPIGTVIRAWTDGGEPWCRLTVRAPASHLRIFWADDRARADWQVFRDTGHVPGMTYAAWAAEARKDTVKKKASRDEL